MLWIKSVLLALCLLPQLGAQQFIYDGRRDKQAQDATAAAKDTSSISLFDKMLRNAGRQSALESGIVTDWQRILGQGAFDNVRVWNIADEIVPARGSNESASGCIARFIRTVAIGSKPCVSLRCKLDHLETQLGVKTDEGGIQNKIDDLRKEIGKLKEEIDKLRKAAKEAQDNSVLAIAVKQLETAQEWIGYADQINKTGILGKTGAIGEIQAAVKEIKELTGIVRGIWDGYNALKPSPTSLLPLHQMLDLELLKIETDRLNQRAKIYARFHLDAGRVKKAIDNARKYLGGALSESAAIEDTVTKLSDSPTGEMGDARVARLKNLDKILTGLHYATRAFAEADLSVNLCSIREGALDRQSDLRRQAAVVSAKEQAVNEGLQRLGLYYKSGIKPSELANLLFSLAGAGALPSSLVK